MATKKTPSDKKPAARKASRRITSKRPGVRTKYVLPAPETTVLEKSLQPEKKLPKKRKPKKRFQASALIAPGYWSFTKEVWKVLWKYKSTFWRLVVVYMLLTALFVGIASQSIYAELSSLMRDTGGELLRGDMSKVGELSELLLSLLSGSANIDVSETGQIVGALLIIIVWLTTIWLLRAFLAGYSPRLRDGFYNSGTPLVPTILLGFVLLLQLIPAAIGATAVSVVIPTGIVSGGILVAILWVVALLLMALSLYWITGTVIALVIITLPGMYPLKALQKAGELVAGRRLKIIKRIVWFIFITIVFWLLFMIPIVVVDILLKGALTAIDWLPIIPIAFVFASSVMMVWAATYMYLLYRRIVDSDDATA